MLSVRNVIVTLEEDIVIPIVVHWCQKGSGFRQPSPNKMGKRKVLRH